MFNFSTLTPVDLRFLDVLALNTTGAFTFGAGAAKDAVREARILGDGGQFIAILYLFAL